MASDDEAPWLQHVPTEQILAELARRTGATNYNPAPVADSPATHTEKPPPQGDALVGQTVEVKWGGPNESYFAEVLSYDAAEKAPYFVRYKDDGLEQMETLAAADFGRGWWLKKRSKARKPAAPVDKHAERKRPEDPTAEEARRAAAKEGLVLESSDDNKTGYLGVSNSGVAGRAFSASFKGKNLGCYHTPEEAALIRARAKKVADEEKEEEEDEEPMTAEEAIAAAEEEGLPLVRSKTAASGFRGVQVCKIGDRGYTASSHTQYLGAFATAEEAALEYARFIGKEAALALAAQEEPGMTAEEVEAAVKAEGLTLVRSKKNTASGFKGVREGYRGNWSANVMRAGGNNVIGNFKSALEAALAVARELGKEGSKAAADKEALVDAKAEEVQFTKEEALAAAEAEGLALCPSQTSSCGYLGISFSAAKEKGGAVSKKPYSASLMGKSLGNYAVPEHAALVRARAMGPEASHRAAKEEEAKIAATQAAPLTKEEALAAAEAEGLTLVPNHKSMTGYKFVTLYSRDAAIEDPSKQRYVIDTIVRRVGGRSAQKKIKRVCATPEEAALEYARALGPEDSKEEAAKMALPDEAPGMTAEEALAAAEAEGLTMVPGNCISGYKYVSQSGPRFALGSHSGMDTRKRFDTPEEAALVYARSLGVEGSKTETEAMIHENPTLAMPIAKRQKLSE